jgi:hypothetical protein
MDEVEFKCTNDRFIPLKQTENVERGEKSRVERGRKIRI